MTSAVWNPEVPLVLEQGLPEETGTKDTPPPPTPRRGPGEPTPQAPMTAHVALPGLSRDLTSDPHDTPAREILSLSPLSR